MYVRVMIECSNFSSLVILYKPSIFNNRGWCPVPLTRRESYRFKGARCVGEENGKRRTTVSINGQNYVISGKADVSHIVEVANFVDGKMKKMREVNPYLDKTQLAVLTAVNISDEYLRFKKQIEKESKKKDGEK